MKTIRNEIRRTLVPALIIALAVMSSCTGGFEKDGNQSLQYSVSMPEPSNHLFHVVLNCEGLKGDTIDFMMPRWMPGYYQIMNYPDQVRNFSVNSSKDSKIPFFIHDRNTWSVVPGKTTSFSISYDVYSDRNFVACNFIDTTHGYINPPATFIYPAGHTDLPVSLKIIPYSRWSNIATGLTMVDGKTDEFTAPDFDILYDCPIMIGNLEELPSFKIEGVVHRFLAYNPGNFDKEKFISCLEKTVREGINIIGDIPYSDYTFIGIGQGYGGIEHLNSTTVPFSGRGLEKPGAMSRMLKFIGHEYFHNYNVKRIRPYELGPFDYERENRTNLLWVSEGLTVYYEYLIVRRAGLMSDDELLKNLEENINTIENDQGRKYQSLSQASYETWDDGPFGNKPGDEDRSISYYEKGPVVGLILDFSIRNATGNKKSLDDVMRLLYWQYYKKLHRGFTDAEFQQACEMIAGKSMSKEFEYVYTTKEINYSAYLSYAGLMISEAVNTNKGKIKFSLSKQENLDAMQLAIFKSWSGN